MDKISGMLGIIKKAGKLVSGSSAVSESVNSGKAECVVVASDASDNTTKRFKNSCIFYNTELKILPLNIEQMSAAVGKNNIAVAAVTDDNLHIALLKAIDEYGGCVYGSANA